VTSELIKEAAAMRGNKLTHGEYEAEATWSTRKFTPFVGPGVLFPWASSTFLETVSDKTLPYFQ
jgi:hypothetical protein